MSPARTKEYDEYQRNILAEQFGAGAGARFARIKACEQKYEKNRKLTVDNLWTDRTWQSEGAVLLKNENYKKWIIDGENDGKPWLIMFL